ncbi:MAG: hypothetical protein LBQ93_01560 [Treponema sp.]|jgi:hypothetical protein|nr:hypothetical protein [Treponema sp.]
MIEQKQGVCESWSIGNTPIETVMQDLVSIIGDEYRKDEHSLDNALCDLLDAWTESEMKDLEELAVNIEDLLRINGTAASNIMWYLVKLEIREGRITSQKLEK